MRFVHVIISSTNYGDPKKINIPFVPELVLSGTKKQRNVNDMLGSTLPSGYD